MSYLTVNGFSCIRGRVVLPLTGTWVADVVSDPESASGTFPNPGASVTMSMGGQSFQGAVRRASNPFGTTFARLIGGAGGLPTVIPALAYQNTTVRQVFSDLLGACGETMASNSDQALLNTTLAFWVRLAGPGWLAMNNLVKTVTPGTWRVLPNGTVWLGVDQYPNTDVGSFELLSYLPQELRAEIYMDNPTLQPGTRFMGGHVTSVEHYIEPAKIHANVLFADAQLATVEASG